MKSFIGIIFVLLMYLNPQGNLNDSSPEQITASEGYNGLSREERLMDAVRYYRSLGFFKQYAELSDQELFQQFDKQLKADWNEGTDPFSPNLDYGYEDFADLYLLAYDTERVWLEDTEADVGPGNEVYIETLKQWAEISGGVFNPANIKETWSGTEGTAKIEYTLNRTKWTLRPEYLNDFIDVTIIEGINESIKKSGKQFGVIVIDQTVFVALLTAEEKQKIEAERGFKFAV